MEKDIFAEYQQVKNQAPAWAEKLPRLVRAALVKAFYLHSDWRDFNAEMIAKLPSHVQRRDLGAHGADPVVDGGLVRRLVEHARVLGMEAQQARRQQHDAGGEHHAEDLVALAGRDAQAEELAGTGYDGRHGR